MRIALVKVQCSFGEWIFTRLLWAQMVFKLPQESGMLRNGCGNDILMKDTGFFPSSSTARIWQSW
jgi:hypothetical protein